MGSHALVLALPALHALGETALLSLRLFRLQRLRKHSDVFGGQVPPVHLGNVGVLFDDIVKNNKNKKTPRSLPWIMFAWIAPCPSAASLMT